MTRKPTPIELDMEVHFQLLKRYDEDVAQEFVAEWESFRVEAHEIASRWSPEQPEYKLRMVQLRKRFDATMQDHLTVFEVIHRKFKTGLFQAVQHYMEVVHDLNLSHRERT